MTKIISISDEAYELLKRLKSERSFSEIVVELTKKNIAVSRIKFAGILLNEEAERLKEGIYADRKLPSRRFN